MATHPDEHAVSVLARHMSTAEPEFLEVQPVSRFLTGVVFAFSAWMVVGWFVLLVLVPALTDGLRFVLLVPFLIALGVLITLSIWLRRSHLVTRLEGCVLSLSGPQQWFFRWRWSDPMPWRIPMGQIRGLRIASYHPGVDGVWGSRSGRAVVISFHDGDEVSVGTARPEELFAALQAAGAGRARTSDAP